MTKVNPPMIVGITNPSLVTSVKSLTTADIEREIVDVYRTAVAIKRPTYPNQNCDCVKQWRLNVPYLIRYAEHLFAEYKHRMKNDHIHSTRLILPPTVIVTVPPFLTVGYMTFNRQILTKRNKDWYSVIFNVTPI